MAAFSGVRLRPGSEELLDFTVAVTRARGASTSSSLDVVLAALVRPQRTKLDPAELAEGATSALLRSLPEPPPATERVAAALKAVGVDIEALVSVPEVTAADDVLADVVRAGAELAARLQREEVFSHHLVAAALADESLRDSDLAELGQSRAELRASLRRAIEVRWSEEPAAVWDEVLGTLHEPPEPVLVGNVDRDLVVWDGKLVDHLGLGTYVDMLCTPIVASRTQLPLSIGLFGEWGSGKSFFMGLMQQRIVELASRSASARLANTPSLFVSEVVQIRFNAWHYADANLWASLAATIFDELAGTDEKERARRQARIDQLLAELPAYKELQKRLDAETAAVQRRVGLLDDQLAGAESRRAEAERKLTDVSARDIAEEVADDPRVQEQRKRVAAALTAIGLDEPVRELVEFGRNVRLLLADAGSVRESWRSGGTRRILIVVVALLLAVAVAGYFLPGVVKALGPTSLVAAVVAAGKLAGLAQRRVVQLREALSEVTSAIEVEADVRERVVARRRVEIDHFQADRDSAAADLRDLQARRAEIDMASAAAEEELSALSPAGRVSRLIAERSSSNDYRRQLGVISLARRDFEKLATSLGEAINAYAEGKGDPPLIERVVLYVDDLDRCPPERVVEVLEAIHLLLAVDLFVVVVGVDPRWMLRALRRRYRGILESQRGDAQAGEYWQTTPQQYLEKIFQIPFVLPGMTRAGYNELLTSLLTVTEPAEVLQAGGATPASGRTGGGAPSTGEEMASKTTAGETGESTQAGDPEQPEELSSEAGSLTDALAHDEALPATLDLTPEEVGFLGRLAPLVRSPRAAKRMMNVYRMLRTTRDLGPASQFLADDFRAVAVLLGVLTGFPQLYGPLCWGDPDDPDQRGRGLLAQDVDTTWSSFVSGLEPTPIMAEKGTKPRGWTNSVLPIIRPDQLDDWSRLVDGLSALADAGRELEELVSYQRWARWVARFSFELSAFAATPDPRPEPVDVPG